jgi:ferredoxin
MQRKIERDEKMVIVYEKCKSCGQCAEICLAEAIEPVRNGNGYAGYEVNQNKCIECGTCLTIDCPSDAIIYD